MPSNEDFDCLSPVNIMAMRVVKWAVPSSLYEPVSGDLLEEFYQRQQFQPSHASYWLMKQCASTVFHFAFKTQRSSLMFIFAFIVFIGVVLMTLLFGSEITTYINVPSGIIVLPPALIFARVSSSKTVFKQAFMCLVNNQLKASLDSLADHISVFKVMGNTAMLMGFFGVVSGAIAMAENIKPGEYSTVLGPATAVLLITLLYGLMVKVVCYLAELRLKAPID